MKLEWAAHLFKGQTAKHKHVFDSAYGIDHYGDLTMLACKCGMGRVYSPQRQTEPAPIIPFPSGGLG